MRTAAKHLIDHEKGRKIAIRAHHQEKKKVYDFESKILLEEEWGPMVDDFQAKGDLCRREERKEGNSFRLHLGRLYIPSSELRE